MDNKVSIDEVISDIEKNINIKSLLSNIADIDSYLDARDEYGFDSKWVSAYEELAPRKNNLTNKEKHTLDKYRERVFKQVIQESGNSEFASYLTDDFELFVLNRLTDSAQPWVDGLMKSYENGNPITS